MANSLIVMPLTDDRELRAWVASRGLSVDDAAVGVAPSVELLVGILGELGWPCAPVESDGRWYANVGGRDGRYPPISDMALDDGCLSFRIGPLFGPWEVGRRVAAACGPQLAVEGGSAALALVTPTTSYEEFHLGVSGSEPSSDGLDRGWSQPPSAADRFRNGRSDLRDGDAEVTVEDSLEYAFTGRTGCGVEAMAVGHAIQAYRWHPQDPTAGRHPLRLDDTRYGQIVDRLRKHLADTTVPIPELVWAFGQAAGVGADLAALANRLRDDPAAAPTLDMTELFLRHHDPDEQGA